RTCEALPNSKGRIARSLAVTADAGSETGQLSVEAPSRSRRGVFDERMEFRSIMRPGRRQQGHDQSPLARDGDCRVSRDPALGREAISVLDLGRDGPVDSRSVIHATLEYVAAGGGPGIR